MAVSNAKTERMFRATALISCRREVQNRRRPQHITNPNQLN